MLEDLHSPKIYFDLCYTMLFFYNYFIFCKRMGFIYSIKKSYKLKTSKILRVQPESSRQIR